MKLEDAVLGEITRGIIRTSRLLYVAVFCLVIASLLGMLVMWRQGNESDRAIQTRQQILEKLDHLQSTVEGRP